MAPFSKMYFQAYRHIKRGHDVGSPFLHKIVNVFHMETAA